MSNPSPSENSLLSAVLQGNIRKTTVFAEFSSSIAQQLQCYYSEIPYLWEQGIFLGWQGAAGKSYRGARCTDFSLPI